MLHGSARRGLVHRGRAGRGPRSSARRRTRECVDRARRRGARRRRPELPQRAELDADELDARATPGERCRRAARAAAQRPSFDVDDARIRRPRPADVRGFDSATTPTSRDFELGSPARGARPGSATRTPRSRKRDLGFVQPAATTATGRRRRAAPRAARRRSARRTAPRRPLDARRRARPAATLDRRRRGTQPIRELPTRAMPTRRHGRPQSAPPPHPRRPI